jgi:hypothetical protein
VFVTWSQNSNVNSDKNGEQNVYNYKLRHFDISCIKKTQQQSYTITAPPTAKIASVRNYSVMSMQSKALEKGKG